MELLGAGQNESAGAVLAVHNALNVGKQRRSALNFVQNHSAAEAPQKPFWIGYGELPLVRVFQTDVGVAAEERPGQGGLPDWRGPVMDTTGNCCAREASLLESVRLNMPKIVGLVSCFVKFKILCFQFVQAVRWPAWGFLPVTKLQLGNAPAR